MLTEAFSIQTIPAILYGDSSESLFLSIHGKMGCKEEADHLAQIHCPKGYQVLSIDLPGHGERTGEMARFVAWEVVPELQAVYGFARQRWKKIRLYANSIGAYFSLLAFREINEKVFAMSFAKVYPMLIAKAERKGRTRDEVLALTAWLTGYSHEQLEELLHSEISYGDFFRKAPALNPARKRIKGSICGVKVETIQDPLMQEIRYLDKLVDELAKGKPMEKILR